MTREDLRRRQSLVTAEPFALGASVKGRPLASLRRRSVAIVLDTLLLFALATPVLLSLTLAAMIVQTPSLARSFVAIFTGDGPEESERGAIELLSLVAKRRPTALPERFAKPLAEGDLDKVKQIFEERPVKVMVDLNADPSFYDPEREALHIRQDVLFGRAASALGYAAFALVYFTLVVWIGRGRTPGKWLMGIRTIKLDGKPLSLWDAFSRAGGYTASLSTLSLGFFESLWDPNRQALHDRVAGTVVVRDPRRGSADPSPSGNKSTARTRVERSERLRE